MSTEILPSTWDQLTTFTPRPAHVLFRGNESQELKPYVEIHPPRERPLWSMHDSSLLTRLSNGFSQYLNDRNLFITPFPSYACRWFQRLSAGNPKDIDQIFLQRILPLVNDLISILHDDCIIEPTYPDLPILEMDGINLTSHFGWVRTPQSDVSAFSIRFEDSLNVEHHFRDILQTRRIPSGTLTDGSAIVMKLALQSLKFDSSLQRRFGMMYTGRYVLFSELHRQEDGSVGILLSDFYDLASASCPFIAVMVYLLLPISAERTQGPPEDILSRIPPIDASVHADIDRSIMTVLPDHLGCLQPLQPLHLSFEDPMLSNVSRPFYPSRTLPATSDPSTPIMSPSLSTPSFSSSPGGFSQAEELLWTADTLILRPQLDATKFSYSASQRPRTVILNTSLRRPYDYTWRGTAEFFDGTIRPIVAKFAFTNLFQFAREVDIHKVLASQTKDTKNCVAPPFYGSYVLRDGSLAVMILGDGGTRLPELDGGWDTTSFEHLEQSQVKQILSKLRAFHQAGFEHGDFKPRNVLVNDDGEIHLIDFGHSGRHRCSRGCEELKWARGRFTELTGVNYKVKTKRRVASPQEHSL